MKLYFHFSNMCLTFESRVAGVFFAPTGTMGSLERIQRFGQFLVVVQIFCGVVFFGGGILSRGREYSLAWQTTIELLMFFEHITFGSYKQMCLLII